VFVFYTAGLDGDVNRKNTGLHTNIDQCELTYFLGAKPLTAGDERYPIPGVACKDRFGPQFAYGLGETAVPDGCKDVVDVDVIEGCAWFLPCSRLHFVQLGSLNAHRRTLLDTKFTRQNRIVE